MVCLDLFFPDLILSSNPLSPLSMAIGLLRQKTVAVLTVSTTLHSENLCFSRLSSFYDFNGFEQWLRKYF